MIKLHGRFKPLNSVNWAGGLISLTSNANLPKALAASRGLILDGEHAPEGYKLLLRRSASQAASKFPEYLIPDDLQHLSEGDVISINPSDGSVQVLHRRASDHNSILLTEQCNHYCLMCSQPPKNVDDSWLLAEVKELIKLIPQDTAEIGFTGGEPTLYGDEFIELMQLTKSYLPNTSIHILSNGRAFKDIEFCRKYAKIGNPDMIVGIPIYSDDPVRHDYVVQAENAFNKTIRGILNLKSLNQKVEIRVVIHKQTIGRLVSLCEFIARNLIFVDHVALMGLEITGFTRANLNLLWIDPYDYKDTLSQAVGILESYGMNVSVYNHQRCLINDDIMRTYRKSISDWKNEYLAECEKCTKLNECGGLFSSAKIYKHSDYIKAFL